MTTAQPHDALQAQDTSAHIHAVLQIQRRALRFAGRLSAEQRQDRLQRAIDLVFDNRGEIVAALSADFGHRSSHQSLMSDIYATIECLRYSKKHVKKWMKPQRRSAPVPMNLLGGRARVEYQAKGVIGIIGTWNFPINTVFAPLAGVFAAGNNAMIKCSEVTPQTAALLAALIGKYFKEEECVAINGGPEVGAAFSAAPFDHLIFTGAGSIAHHILHAAADNLTPVTLELGGKSPVIISDSYDITAAAERIVQGKILNVGQVCLSPDYVLVPEDKLEVFCHEIMEQLSGLFDSLLDNPDYSSVVNSRHFQRLQSYIQDARDHGADVREFNPANEDFSQQQGTHKMPLTLVVNPDDELLVMREELFGPVLCVKSYRRLDDCLDYIADRPHPLALYYFGNDKLEQQRVIQRSLSGAVTINDVIFHVSCEDLPFGGIGPSGMGNYHGRDGFKTFSHARAIYKQSKINLQKLGGMIPPYGDKADKTLQAMIRK